MNSCRGRGSRRKERSKAWIQPSFSSNFRNSRRDGDMRKAEPWVLQRRRASPVQHLFTFLSGSHLGQTSPNKADSHKPSSFLLNCDRWFIQGPDKLLISLKLGSHVRAGLKMLNLRPHPKPSESTSTFILTRSSSDSYIDVSLKSTALLSSNHECKSESVSCSVVSDFLQPHGL